jgi:pSer/pThr/pTyr-binding forkhead associated (FHA) protein
MANRLAAVYIDLPLSYYLMIDSPLCKSHAPETVIVLLQPPPLSLRLMPLSIQTGNQPASSPPRRQSLHRYKHKQQILSSCCLALHCWFCPFAFVFCFCFRTICRQMFTHPRPAPTPPSLSTSSSTAPPSSPTRTSRLRGLSYLVLGYTQNHAHSHTESGNSQPPTSPGQNSTNASAHTSPSSPTSNVPHSPQPQQFSSDPHPSATNTDCSSGGQSSSAATGGWLPAIAGRSAHSRIATQATTNLKSPTSNESTGNTGNHSNFFASIRKARSGSAPLSVQDRQNGNMQNSRSATEANGEAGHNALEPPPVPANEETGSSDPSARNNISHAQLPSIRFVPHHDPRSNRPSLVFSPISRTLPTPDAVIRVGRYSERDNNVTPAPNTPSSAPVGYKSKVVSRRHCEFWCTNGQWFIKDVRSSSGTFLNHIRLSSPGVESRPWPVNDGDVVQLGIDFRGGEEMIFRCVKIRVECNRGWQKGLNNFKYVATHYGHSHRLTHYR